MLRILAQVETQIPAVGTRQSAFLDIVQSKDGFKLGKI